MALRNDRTLQLLFTSLFFWMFGIGLYEQLVPIYARQLGASAVQLGTLFTVRHMALAGGFLIGWVVVDRWSPRAAIVTSWLAAVPVPLMLAAAPNYAWLVPGLLLYEVAYFGMPSMNAFVARRVPASELASTFGAMGTITSLGFLISPTVGGMIADRFGIRITLVVAAAFYVLSSFLVLRIRWDEAGAPAQRASDGLSLDQLRGLMPVMWIFSGTILVVLITVPFATPFLREVRGLSLSQIGFLGSMVALGAVLLTPVAGRIGDRIGPIPTLAGGLVVFALGVLLTVYGPAALLPVVAILRCRSPLNTLGHALVAAKAPPAVLGRAFALAGILMAVLGAGGSFVGGYAYLVDPALPLLVSVGMAVAIAGALVWWQSRAAARSAPDRA